MDYKTDDEKVEELKAWWKENGTSVVAGVALAVAGLFGWEYWKDWKEATAAEASTLYTEVKQQVDSQSMDKATSGIAKLQADYDSTPYAAIASLKEAQHYATQGQYDQAATALRWVIANSKEDSFKPLASLRLARVLLAMQQPDEAMKLVSQPYPQAYQSLLEELKGDIYTVKNQTAEARAAYDNAIRSSSGSYEFIQMKRDNLGQG